MQNKADAAKSSGGHGEEAFWICAAESWTWILCGLLGISTYMLIELFFSVDGLILIKAMYRSLIRNMDKIWCQLLEEVLEEGRDGTATIFEIQSLWRLESSKEMDNNLNLKFALLNAVKRKWNCQSCLFYPLRQGADNLTGASLPSVT